jgi:hypothetical protein
MFEAIRIRFSTTGTYTTYRPMTTSFHYILYSSYNVLPHWVKNVRAFAAHICGFPAVTIDINPLDSLKPPGGPSQHISSCSSLHKRNGARNLGGKPPYLLYEE